jgi:hypothetical protein
MQFLKKHYEKILLGIVLTGLIGVLVFMLFYIAADKQAMEATISGVINAPAKALPALDLTTNDAAMARLQSPVQLDLATVNMVFNPFEWQRSLDGRLIKKDTSVGAQVAVVTGITPLYLVLTLDSVMTNELGARYIIGVEKQAAATPVKRHKQQRYVSPGEKPNDTFALLEVKGPPENPDALVLKILDTGETASVAYSHPFRRVDGYMADLRYDPEKKVFRGRRTGDKISFGGTDYVFVEIKQDGLTLSDQSNGKKTSLPFAP